MILLFGPESPYFNVEFKAKKVISIANFACNFFSISQGKCPKPKLNFLKNPMGMSQLTVLRWTQKCPDLIPPTTPEPGTPTWPPWASTGPGKGLERKFQNVTGFYARVGPKNGRTRSRPPRRALHIFKLRPAVGKNPSFFSCFAMTHGRKNIEVPLGLVLGKVRYYAY